MLICLNRISDWVANEEHIEKDDYVQNQLSFLNNLVKDAEDKNKYYFCW